VLYITPSNFFTKAIFKVSIYITSIIIDVTNHIPQNPSISFNNLINLINVVRVGVNPIT